MKHKNIFPLTTLLLSLLWLGFYLLFRDNASIMTAVCEAVVRPFQRFTAKVSALLPFSLGELLCYLAERADQVFSREQLLQEVWGYEYFGDIRTVDVTVRRLREKLEDKAGEPQYIMTKRGVGYYFRRP